VKLDVYDVLLAAGLVVLILGLAAIGSIPLAAVIVGAVLTAAALTAEMTRSR